MAGECSTTGSTVGIVILVILLLASLGVNIWLLVKFWDQLKKK